MQFLDTYVKLILVQVGQDDSTELMLFANGSKVRLSCLGYFESFDASFLSVYCKL